MKRLQVLAFACFFIAISMVSLTVVHAQKGGGSNVTDVTNPNARIKNMGCYTTHILDCGFQLGDQLVCNFTGSYGAPYNYTAFGCYGGTANRHCVLAY
jgi:hypothetical protein